MEGWARVLEVLSHGAVSSSAAALPRRATCDPATGALAERAAPRLGGAADAPLLPELEVLSQLCHETRVAHRKPSWSRDTGRLVELALGVSARERGAWMALYHDSLTGDLDDRVAVAALRSSPDRAAAALVLAAGVETTLGYAAAVVARVLERGDDADRAAFGGALGPRLSELVAQVQVHAARLPDDALDALMAAVGGALAAARLGSEAVRGVLEQVLRGREACVEGLGAVLQCEALGAACDAEVVELALDKAESLVPDSRYPVLALLARVDAGTSFGEAAAARTSALAVDTLRRASRPLDARCALACAHLAGATHSPWSGALAETTLALMRATAPGR